jgi:hypothetical protein
VGCAVLEIDLEDAAELNDVYERALKVLSEAEPVFSRLAKTPARRDYLLGYAGVVADILSNLKAPLALRYPDLKGAPPESAPTPDV